MPTIVGITVLCTMLALEIYAIVCMHYISCSHHQNSTDIETIDEPMYNMQASQLVHDVLANNCNSTEMRWEELKTQLKHFGNATRGLGGNLVLKVCTKCIKLVDGKNEIFMRPNQFTHLVQQFHWVYNQWAAAQSPADPK